MTPFQMTPRSLHQGQWPCDLDFHLEAKSIFLDFVAAGGIVFHKHTFIFSSWIVLYNYLGIIKNSFLGYYFKFERILSWILLPQELP